MLGVAFNSSPIVSLIIDRLPSPNSMARLTLVYSLIIIDFCLVLGFLVPWVIYIVLCLVS